MKIAPAWRVDEDIRGNFRWPRDAVNFVRSKITGTILLWIWNWSDSTNSTRSLFDMKTCTFSLFGKKAKKWWIWLIPTCSSKYCRCFVCFSLKQNYELWYIRNFGEDAWNRIVDYWCGCHLLFICCPYI